MDTNEEYHDPDYPEVPVCVKEEPPSISDEEKVEKIKAIIRREFSNELEVRENEVMLIDQRMTTSRRLLHRLRYAIVSSYYNELKLQVTNGQIQDEVAVQRDPRAKAEISALLREGQREIHPSVRKLLGKKSVDLSEIFKTRAPRNKVRRDYSAMLQKRNYTISADATKSLRPDKKPEMEVDEEPCTSRPKKIPRHLDPKATNVLTLDEITRNQTKHRYRIVIGNTSKYAPPASRADRSTHKWLLYVRGPAHAPDLSRILTGVTVRLHHSYAPHHTVHLDKPPFHITRRGWGEFPALVELQFVLPQRNRPAALQHTVKLDRNYTGVQTLGAETLVDVWLYSTPEMLPYEYKEDTHTDTQTDTETIAQTQTQPKVEPEEQPDTNGQTDTWLEFFSKEPTELDVDEMIIKPTKPEEKSDLDALIESNVISKAEEVTIKHEPVEELPDELLNQPVLAKKRIVKYIEPNTGKIYYLEMDRTLDLSKVQEIIINNTTAKISPIKSNGLKNVRRKKGGVSLLKPEVKNLLSKNENSVIKSEVKRTFTHIENDHCYLATPFKDASNVASVEIKKEVSLYECLCAVVCRFHDVRSSVNYLIKRIPIISDQARDPDFLTYFPFVVESCAKYWKLDFAKRRNIEWSRAKLINKILTEHYTQTEQIWRTKQILLYSRLHGHYPIRNESFTPQVDNQEWSSWNDMENLRKMETNIKEIYPHSTDISTLSIFQSDEFERSVSESISLTESDDEIDVVNCHSPVRVKKEVVREDSFNVLPVENSEDRMKYLFIEKKCADIGIELRCEDVGNGYSYSAVHAVILSAVKSFAEELIRSALAAKLTQESSSQSVPTVWAGSSSRTVISLEHVYRATTNPRLHALTAKDIGAEKKNTYSL